MFSNENEEVIVKRIAPILDVIKKRSNGLKIFLGIGMEEEHGNVEGFECQKCGECCKDSRYEGDKIGFISDTVFVATDKMYITPLCWEKNRIEARVKDQRLNFKPCTVMYDLKNKQSIVLNYTTTTPSCPLLSKEDGCQIYDIRPKLCESFPLLMGPVEILQSEKLEIYASKCKNDFSRADFIKTIVSPPTQKSIVMKNLYQRYKDAFLSRLFLDFYALYVGRYIESFETDGYVKTAKKGYNEKYLMKKINASPSIDASKLIESYSGDKIEKVIAATEGQINKFLDEFSIMP